MQTAPTAHDHTTFSNGAANAYCKAQESMEADGYYAEHSRVECAVEIRRRATAIMTN